jgi:hypothetical protein
MLRKPMVWDALFSLGMLAAASLPARAQAPDAQTLVAPVNLLVQAINQGATTCPPGVFAEDAVVIDDFPPYHWSGHGAGCDWYLALVGTDAASRAAFTALHGHLHVGAPQFSRASGDDAYFVLPGVFVFDVAENKRVQQSSSWLITERRVAGQWLIAGHAWAIRSEVPVH